MKKSWGLWGLAAALTLGLTACGMSGGNAARNNGTITDGDGTLTGNRGATDFGDKGAVRNDGASYDSGGTYDNGATYDNGTTYDNGVTYDDGVTYDNGADRRSMMEEAADALENGVRRARDSVSS